MLRGYHSITSALHSFLILFYSVRPLSPINLRVEQTGVTAATVSWIAPSPPPAQYRITVNFSEDVITSETSYTFQRIAFGPQIFRVVSVSPAFTSDTVQQEITLLGQVGILVVTLHLI